MVPVFNSPVLLFSKFRLNKKGSPTCVSPGISSFSVSLTVAKSSVLCNKMFECHFDLDYKQKGSPTFVSPGICSFSVPLTAAKSSVLWNKMFGCFFI